MAKEIDLSEFYHGFRNTCKTAQIIATLSPEDQEKFEAACREAKISVDSLSTWLSDKSGQQASYSTTRLHRLGKCSCD